MDILGSNEEKDKNLITEIINNTEFINLLDGIMRTTVMKNANYIINQFYTSNGKIDLDKEIEIIKSKKDIDLKEEEQKYITLSKNNTNLNKEKN